MSDFRYIVHKDLDKAGLNAICRLKAIAFPYDLKKQKQWIRNNIKSEDIHLIYKPGRTMLAYLNIVKINSEIDGSSVEAYGIGNVCSREKGKGYGAIIMSEINRFLDERLTPGMLFCRKTLVPFYQKTGWMLVTMGSVSLSAPDQPFETMVYNFPKFKNIKYSGRLF